MQDPLELDERLLVEDDVVEVAAADAAWLQTEVDGRSGKP